MLLEEARKPGRPKNVPVIPALKGLPTKKPEVESEVQRERKLVQSYKIFKEDIKAFADFFFSHILSVPIAEFHKEILNLLPKEERLVIVSPRRHAKSTIIDVIYVLWCCCFNVKKSIIIISASEELAVEFLRQVKHEFETNEKLRAYFGIMKSYKWAETHIIVKNKLSTNIRARGAGAQIRGFGADCLICDDLETNESVESEEQRKKIKDWLLKDCLNILLPGCQFILVGTIIHPLCVLNDLLTVDNGWTKRKYKAYKDGVEKEENVLWTSMWSHKSLQERKREIGSFRFSSEYLNEPLSDGTAPVKESQIRYWTVKPTQYSTVIAVDPAYSEDESADYKVASLIGLGSDMSRYLFEYVRTHCSIGEFYDAIINLWLANKLTTTAVCIPNSGVEKSFFDGFQKRCDERKVYPPLMELKNSFTNAATQTTMRNKKSRIIAALQPLFENGKYYIHPDHLEARDEILTIGSSRWDDVVDTMAYAEQLFSPGIYFNTKMEYDDGDSYDSDELVLMSANYGLG